MGSAELGGGEERRGRRRRMEKEGSCGEDFTVGGVAAVRGFVREGGVDWVGGLLEFGGGEEEWRDPRRRMEKVGSCGEEFTWGRQF